MKFKYAGLVFLSKYMDNCIIVPWLCNTYSLQRTLSTFLPSVCTCVFVARLVTCL